MWKYVKRYLPYAVLAAAFMVGEVLMDLLQPELMSRIADDGVLGVHTGGVGNMSLIWALGLKMTCLVLFGGLCGSLNNAFVHMTGQNVGNDIRKDAFRRLMTFSFPQVDCFGTGSLVTRMTNDITQVQNLVSQFVRGISVPAQYAVRPHCIVRVSADCRLYGALSDKGKPTVYPAAGAAG